MLAPDVRTIDAPESRAIALTENIMTDAILVLNAGSSSLKFPCSSTAQRARRNSRCAGQNRRHSDQAELQRARCQCATLAEHELGAAARPGHEGAARFLLDWLEQRLGRQRLLAAGHRVVHGGREFSAPVRVNAAVLDALRAAGAACAAAPAAQSRRHPGGRGARARTSPGGPASILHSTRGSRHWLRHSHCPGA